MSDLYPSGGFAPRQTTTIESVGAVPEFLRDLDYSTIDITLVNTGVSANANGRKVVPAGQVLGKITATGKYGLYSEAGQTDESVSINNDASSGTFTLSWDGETTAAISYVATAAAVQAALEALSNIDPGDIVCTGGPLGTAAVIITFAGRYAGQNLPDMTKDDTSLVGGTTTLTVTDGSASTVTDGRAVAQGVLFSDLDVTDGDVIGAMVIRANVYEARLTGLNDNAKVDLAGRFFFA